MSSAVGGAVAASRATDGVADGVTSGFAAGRAFAEVSRMGLAVVPLPVYVLAALAAQAGTLRTVAGCLSLACGLAMAGALNDLTDVEADSLGAKSTRALVEGRLSRHQVRVFASFTGSCGLLAAVPLRQPVSLALFVAAAIGAWSYSAAPLRLKGRSFLGTIDLAIAYLVVPLVLGVAQRDRVLPLAQVALVSFGLIVCAQGVVWHKDVPDVHSDMHTGTSTPVVRHGSHRLGRWSCPVVVAGAVMVVAGTGGRSVLTHVALVWLATVTVVIARSGVDHRRANSARWAMALVAASSGVVLAGL